MLTSGTGAGRAGSVTGGGVGFETVGPLAYRPPMPATAPTAPPNRSRSWVTTALAVAAAALLTAAALGAAAVLAGRTGRPLSDFTRDVASAAGAPAYVGFVSQLTVLLWAAGAGAGFAGALGAADPARRRFLAGLGLLTAGLAADDALMLHEALLPALGVPETAVLLYHAGLAAAAFALGRAAARRTDWALLACAAAGAAGSVAADQIPYGGVLWEDAAKLFGAACWAAYVLTAAGDGVPRR